MALSGDVAEARLILIGEDQVSEIVDQIAERMTKLNKQTAVSGKKAWKEWSKGANAAFEVVEKIGRVAQGVFDTVRDAAKAETIGKKFKEAFGPAAVNMERLRDAIHGTVDDVTIQRLALVGQRLALTRKQIAGILNLAGRISAAGGDTARIEAEKVFGAVASGEFEPLRRAGIVTRQVAEEMKLLGTAAQRATAIIARGEVVISDFADSSVAKIGKIEARWKNAEIAAKKVALTIAGPLLDAVNAAGKASDAAIGGMGALLRAAADAATDPLISAMINNVVAGQQFLAHAQREVEAATLAEANALNMAVGFMLQFNNITALTSTTAAGLSITVRQLTREIESMGDVNLTNKTRGFLMMMAGLQRGDPGLLASGANLLAKAGGHIKRRRGGARKKADDFFLEFTKLDIAADLEIERVGLEAVESAWRVKNETALLGLANENAAFEHQKQLLMDINEQLALSPLRSVGDAATAAGPGFAALNSELFAQAEIFGKLEKAGDPLTNAAPGAIVASGRVTAAFIKDAKARSLVMGAMELAASFASFAIGDLKGGGLHLAASILYGVAAATAGSAGGGGTGRVGRRDTVQQPDQQAQRDVTFSPNIFVSGVVASDVDKLGRTLAPAIGKYLPRAQFAP